MPRDRFVFPGKGTNARKIVNLLLKPQGLTGIEAFDRGLVRQPHGLNTLIARLEYDCGFDVRAIGRIRYGPGRGRAMYIHRIFGRHAWNGQYRSYLRPGDILAEAA